MECRGTPGQYENLSLGVSMVWMEAASAVILIARGALLNEVSQCGG